MAINTNATYGSSATRINSDRGIDGPGSDRPVTELPKPAELPKPGAGPTDRMDREPARTIVTRDHRTGSGGSVPKTKEEWRERIGQPGGLELFETLLAAPDGTPGKKAALEALDDPAFVHLMQKAVDAKSRLLSTITNLSRAQADILKGIVGNIRA